MSRGRRSSSRARRSPRAVSRRRPRSYETFQQVCELLDARRTRQAVAPFVRERRAVELAGAPARMQVDERRADRVLVVRCRNDARAGVANQLRSRPVRWHDGEDRAFGGDVLEDLARENAASAASGLRDEQKQGVGISLQTEGFPAGHVVDQLDAVAEPQRVEKLAVAGPEVADEA